MEPVLLGVLVLLSLVGDGPSSVVVMSERRGLDGSDDLPLRRAVLEARRYLYELSAELPSLGELTATSNRSIDGSALLGTEHRVLVANADRLAHIHPQLVDDGSPPPREPGSHFVQLVISVGWSGMRQ